MTADSTIAALNRLLKIHLRALPHYLSYAAPAWRRGEDAGRMALQSIADDQHATAERIGELIIELGGTLDPGHFPMEFTGFHDLSFKFLLKQMTERQRREIAQIERCVNDLSLNPMAKALAEESLGAAKGHLETMLELQQPTAAAGSHAT